MRKKQAASPASLTDAATRSDIQPRQQHRPNVHYHGRHRPAQARSGACSGSADQVFTMDRIGRSGLPEYAGLAFAASLAQAQAIGPVHVVIDATGLEVYGAGAWLAEKHGERGTRTWRKLHLAVDSSTGEILVRADGQRGR